MQRFFLLTFMTIGFVMPAGAAAQVKVGEIIIVGRAGTLIDWEGDVENRVYASLYTAENILNWRVERINGRNVPTMIVLYEGNAGIRQIFLDGRPLPKNAQPTWMGYSVGKWEGDTLVVETIGQNGRTWLDMRGLPGTESLRVIERFKRRTIGQMDIDVTIDDPKAYTKPWDVKLNWSLQPDTDLIESICEENNKDPAHMVGK